MPRAPIKRIMKAFPRAGKKQSLNVHSVECMADATQVFIGSIAKLAWEHSTQKCRRRTLQVKDIMAAVQSSSRLEFLSDAIRLFEEEEQQKRSSQDKESSLTRLGPPHDLETFEAELLLRSDPSPLLNPSPPLGPPELDDSDPPPELPPLHVFSLHRGQYVSDPH